ncbi:hypothetical protein BX666DRAFT_1262568 [Dichotomocladium elegans]|nr:hypothetical protein BX666DRAFT_1262568 [Dichotomocladium elegans]
MEEIPEALSQSLLDQEANAQTCFICNERLHGDLDAVNLHIDNCLATIDAQQQQQTGSNNDANSGWEEYEWAGQTRVRASAMMEGGYGGAGFATASKREEDEDDEDLDVEDDDDAKYGAVQYTEGDVVFGAEEDEDAEALREMVAGSSNTRRSPDQQEHEQQGQQRSDYEDTVSDENWRRTAQEDALQAEAGGHSRLIVESLKSRIHQLELTARSAPRCLICLEPYKTPLTSIVCWHVHCEQCWLQTLGSKKLCPQCQKITGPSDLRRIYL